MRLTFDIDEETHEIIARIIPHGMRKYAYRAILKGFAEALERNPKELMAALVENTLSYKQFIERDADGFKKQAARDSPNGGNSVT